MHSAIEDRPANAGIAPELIDKLADSCIKSHVTQSRWDIVCHRFARAVGSWLQQSLPTVAQFYWHAIVLSQKLAYLYGWPDILEEGAVDDETELRSHHVHSDNDGRWKMLAKQLPVVVGTLLLMQSPIKLPMHASYQDSVVPGNQGDWQVGWYSGHQGLVRP